MLALSPIASVAEMVGFDRATIDSGVPSLELMERAGKGVYQHIKRMLKGKTRCLILCGPGNNGGDGLVVARLLKKSGFKVEAVLCSGRRYSEDNSAQLKKCLAAKVIVRGFSPEGQALPTKVKKVSAQELSELISSAKVVVDALLGTGQCSAPTGSIGAAMSLLERAKDKRIISIDVPSGVNADSGECYAPHVNAALTVTIQLSKRGLYQSPACEAAGALEVLPIGIDTSAGCEYGVIDGIKKWPVRRRAAHKGDFGSVFILGGSINMPGAPELAARAALRAGAGLVFKSVKPGGSVSSWPEVILHHGASFSDFSQKIRDCSCLVFGPGLGLDREAKALVEEALGVISEIQMPSVIDADALTLIAEMLKVGRTFSLPSAVITPHPGEAARLLGVDTAAVQHDRYSAARKLSELLNCTALLKGAGTVIYGRGRGIVNASGNPYMATAGSGDVLSGILGAFLAQDLAGLYAAAAAAFLHGKAGDLAYHEIGGPLVASDLIAYLPKAWQKEFRQRSALNLVR
ncbi:MAG: hypothetical protein DCC75_10840 [Proteobacteria bacterium]|nr:MAG: hypothetical protein DCC75_10840 [Pseudomonadota bacterium]